MTYTTDQVFNGLMNYADAEIMNKLPTSSKWVAGTALGLATRRMNNIIEILKENAIVNMLGIIDEDGNVDVDELIAAMRSASDKYGKLTLDIPLVGRLSFNSSDIDNLRNFII